MKKFEELSFEENQKIEGGFIFNPIPVSWSMSVIDFCKGVVEGVSAGFDQAPKYEPKH